MDNIIRIPARPSTAAISELAVQAGDEFTFIFTKSEELRPVDGALHRMMQVARYTGASMVYADHFSIKGGEESLSPVIDYQDGALRDDFDFGGLLLIRTSALKEAAREMDREYKYAGLYDLRLRLSRKGSLVRIPEPLYYEVETDLRKSGEKQFDYVDPRNREVQVEMEKACTEHLRTIGALLTPPFKDADFSCGDFPVEASVIIPCRNRAATIADAIRSALSQKTSFPYNVIVVDDHSDDGTVDIIRGFEADSRLVFIQQGPGYHAIGGNWNAAIADPRCGRFALQLDSDDVYSDGNTVQRFVDAFHAQRAAMIIGSYRLTDIDLNEIPPGVIDHREWTDDNGMNNALRINGLGAPRGFWTPLLREIGFPVVKYGEDYAVALRICREYRIGRIYDVMYNCRRWRDNSDADLSVEKVNANNLYKDRIRTWELRARMAMLSSK